MHTKKLGALVATLTVGISVLVVAPARADGEEVLSRGGCDSFSPFWGPGVCIWHDTYDTGAGITFEHDEPADNIARNNVPVMSSGMTLVAADGGSDGAGLPVKNNAGSAWNFDYTLAVTFCVNSYYGGNRDRIAARDSDYTFSIGLYHNEASLFFSY